MWREFGLGACLILTLSIAGCLSDEGGPQPTDPDAALADAANNTTVLPEDIVRSITIGPSFDIPRPNEEEFCQTPTHNCVRVPFTVENPGVRILATLSWGMDANNIGLFLYEGDEIVVYDSGPRATGTFAEISHTFEHAGDFALVVDPHWTTTDTAELEATFSTA